MQQCLGTGTIMKNSIIYFEYKTFKLDLWNQRNPGKIYENIFTFLSMIRQGKRAAGRARKPFTARASSLFQVKKQCPFIRHSARRTIWRTQRSRKM